VELVSLCEEKGEPQSRGDCPFPKDATAIKGGEKKEAGLESVITERPIKERSGLRVFEEWSMALEEGSKESVSTGCA